MPPEDLQAIFGPLTGDPYVYQEVIEGGAGEISPTEYTGTGDVTEFRYGDLVSAAVRDGDLVRAAGVADQMLLGSEEAVAFIDNHDTQRNGRPLLSYKDGSSYAFAEAFMLAWPYGHAQVMSSFAFDATDQGPPTAQDWWSGGASQVAFGRGDKGFAVFNRDANPLERTFQTSLPAGTYCDVAAGDPGDDACPTYQVGADGTVTATVPANGMLALHAGSRVD